MAEKQKPEGLKTMLKGNSESTSGNNANSVKDQVKQALLRNRAKKQNQGQPNPGILNSSSPNGAQSQQNPASQSPPNQKGDVQPVVSKIEKTVDSINEVHTTMESLNKNMNMFVDLFNKRGASLGASSNAPLGSSSSSSGTKTNLSQMEGKDLGKGQNAVTTLLLTNLLKKGEDEENERLKDLERGTPEYLNLLTKKLEKFQSEFELLQYLYEPKTVTGNLAPTEDAQGNSTWLAGFMSMMLKRK
mgnify:CR=1 FL=1